ncbi:2,3-diaminopropionate biosynthesis protein SbnB [Actinacidiphila sp. ITFR-21]|uniref:2,3-diaminopropionate biosynthesis protein SbnB n=1 Tax=Actinacidiphila sp. ITFR-21 TaxID=3075199 RepID=UPI00288A6552|nr:2,3-diaminopropionate biosynthesis protein SbnB [Streptomyces sp. ITFR-21]WNI18866.1 2,3-diaminopropionate biosynthesis protein SbnB [Streptomyces sp. ITFR-21]
MFSFDVVSGKVAKDILDTSVDAVVALVEDAYLRHDAGRTVNPDSYFLRFPDRPDARIIALPAAIDLADERTVGIKWISSFPGNVTAGIPRASAVLVLNDGATGYPVALLEAAGISAARTAASAAVAARAFARHLPPDGRLAVVGAGVIARTVLRYLAATGYPIEELRVLDPDQASAGSLVRFAADELGLAARPAADIEDVLGAGTVVTATTAATPYIDRALRPGQVALNISLRDFAPEVILGAQNYFDDVEHCMKADTSPHLAEQATGGRDFVDGTLADVLNGSARPDAGRGLVFSPFGLGVLDLAVGHHVLATAREQGLSLEVPDFFGETRRW